MTNTISQRIRSNAALVETALQGYLDGEDRDFGVIYDAERYAVLDGGKRIRPFLVLEFCRMLGGKDESAMPLACALEMIHSYSLVHDDLPCMDNDDMRRGKPSCHKQYGEANGLLAGDALLTDAFGVVAGAQTLTDAQKTAAVAVLACAAGSAGMVAGQILDLKGETEPFDYETLLRMNRLKTGCLMGAACRLGCIAAGRDETEAAALYADRIGLLFQLVDDLLDAGEEDQKTTFLTFMTQDEARAQAKVWTDEAKAAVASIDGSEILLELADFLLTRKA